MSKWFGDSQCSTNRDAPSWPCSLRSHSGLVRTVVAVLAAWSVILGVLSPLMAQAKTVLVAGRVQWIAAGKMMVIPDNGGLPVQVDITQVNQDQYKLLAGGTPVTVVGAVAPDGPRVMIATSVSPGAAE